MPALYGGPVIYCRHCTVVPIPSEHKHRYQSPRFCPTCARLRLIPARRRACRKSLNKEYWYRRQHRLCTKCRAPVDKFAMCNECRAHKQEEDKARKAWKTARLLYRKSTK